MRIVFVVFFPKILDGEDVRTTKDVFKKSFLTSALFWLFAYVACLVQVAVLNITRGKEHETTKRDR